MPDAAPKPVSASRVEMTQVVMPGDANILGTAFGGKVMEWTDLAAAVAAQRHARLPVVTASIDQLAFLAPVRIGQVAVLRAQVNAVFGTSMEVGVLVLTEDPLTGEHRKCCSAYLTFVALGKDGRPTRVPKLKLETEDDVRRERAAQLRRASRLQLRAELAPRVTR